VRLGLADQDRPGLPQRRDRGRVAVGDVLGEHARAVGRGHAGGVEDVLGRERDACERSGGVVGLGSGAVEAERGERAERGVQLLDALAQRVHDLARRELPRRVAAEQLGR
jgi:hypothetical protein